MEIYIEKESATSACKLKFKRENGQKRIKLVIAIAKCQRAMILPIHHFHIDHNAPCLAPKILYNHCFQFLLGITVIPREIQDNGYTKFEGGGGVNKVHYGLCENGEYALLCNLFRNV